MVNLLELQKQGIIDGDIREVDVAQLEKNTAVIRFRDINGVLLGEYLGKTARPQDTDDTITEGTWICRVRFARNVYYAEGIQKVDSQFLLGIMESQRRTIIDTLWEENREFVMEYMGNKYSEEVTLKRIADARNEAAKEYQEQILQLEQEAESLREELDRSNALLESARNTPPAAAAEVPEGPTELETVPKVRRVSEEGIYCRLFDRTRYFVHISYDRRTMFVQPHDFGKTVCINGELVLSNFGKLVPFVGECDLRQEYVPGKGFYIHFDRTCSGTPGTDAIPVADIRERTRHIILSVDGNGSEPARYSVFGSCRLSFSGSGISHSGPETSDAAILKCNTQQYNIMAISLRVSPQEQTLIENYANVHGISVSETLRKAFFEMIEDEIDLEYCLKSIASYESSGKTYTLDELDQEFDHRCLIRCFNEEAYKNLKKLDHSVNLYIRSWLRKNLEDCDDPRILGKEVKGQFVGIWRYRVGDYRVCTQIRERESMILVVAIRHRSGAYGLDPASGTRMGRESEQTMGCSESDFRP